jgi:hypothetical protein
VAPPLRLRGGRGLLQRALLPLRRLGVEPRQGFLVAFALLAPARFDEGLRPRSHVFRLS